MREKSALEHRDALQVYIHLVRALQKPQIASKKSNFDMRILHFLITVLSQFSAISFSFAVSDTTVFENELDLNPDTRGFQPETPFATQDSDDRLKSGQFLENSNGKFQWEIKPPFHIPC